ncbi:hypothetical protein L596_001883 [Steinernema carpocapsae]|uniref:Uncharacterized protein n=1 Tax=Steinernema carpocapsae TaxID=34508 RepID=A0A4U8UPL0_STECR|nr:hypothetical protein L596_001883 [Steinernema carpocapsae]
MASGARKSQFLKGRLASCKFQDTNKIYTAHGRLSTASLTPYLKDNVCLVRGSGKCGVNKNNIYTGKYLLNVII